MRVGRVERSTQLALWSDTLVQRRNVQAPPPIKQLSALLGRSDCHVCASFAPVAAMTLVLLARKHGRGHNHDVGDMIALRLHAWVWIFAYGLLIVPSKAWMKGE